MDMNFSILRYLLQMREQQWWDKEKIEQLQSEKLNSIIPYAKKTAYYQDKLFDYPKDFVFGDLPITDKNDVRNDPDLFIRNGVQKDSLTMYRTSGSTGEPVRVFLDDYSVNYRRGLNHFISSETGRTAFDTVIRIGSRGEYYKPRYESNFGLYKNLFFHANEDRQKMLSIIRSKKANILTGYPSMLFLLAKANHDVKLKYAYCGAEMLTKDYRKAIEESFSCPVFDRYQCWEFGPVSWECPEEHNMHVNSNSVVLEIVDSNGKPKKSGVGEILLTSLSNKAMPLMRYRIGDLAGWGNECSCGRGLPVLKSIEGRSDDMITLPSGKKITPMAIMVEHQNDMYKEMLAYQVVQERPDLLVVKIVPNESGFRQEKIMIEKMKQAFQGEEVKVEIEIVDKIERIGSKLRRVISKVK